MKGHFGSQLRKARDARGYTQKALGELIGMSANSIARIEKGKLGMRWSKLEAVVDALGQSPAYYFSTAEPKAIAHPRVIHDQTSLILLGGIVADLATFDKSKIDAVLTLVESLRPVVVQGGQLDRPTKGRDSGK